jgi:DNA uptake protein ComE-like DNA-binding protein
MAEDEESRAEPGEASPDPPGGNPRAGVILPVGPHDQNPHSTAPDLNAAGADDIAAVDFVGAHLAHTIVSAREQRGRFRSWEELREVTGLKANKVAELQRAFRLSASP